jgi:MFS family permease
VLFLTVGLGMSMPSAVGVIAIVVVAILIAAPVSGKLGDRFGKTRVVGLALWLFGVGLLVPFLTQSPFIVLPILPFVAFGGGMILTLPHAILMPLMPDEEHGLITGFYSFSRGLGILLGPLLAGVAITALRSSLGSTQGYAAMWLVRAAAILASLAFMKPLQAREAQLRRQRDRDSPRQAPEGAAA